MRGRPAQVMMRTMDERTYHPECTTYDWKSSRTLTLVDTTTDRIAGQIEVTGDEWERLVAAGVDQLFSGQVPETSLSDADDRVRAVIGRGFN